MDPGQEYTLAIGWLIGSLAVGIWSDKKGFGLIQGFGLALLLSPLLGAVIVAVRNPKREVVESHQIASGEMKRCPACSELIRPQAKKCRFCGEQQSGSDILPRS